MNYVLIREIKAKIADLESHKFSYNAQYVEIAISNLYIALSNLYN